MKNVQMASLGLLMVALVIMATHVFVFPFPDWIVRADGIVMIIGLFTLTLSTVRRRAGKRGK